MKIRFCIRFLCGLIFLIGIFCHADSINQTIQKDGITAQHSLQDSYEISYYKYFLVVGVMFALLLVLYIIRLRQGRGTQVSSISIEQSRILDSKNRITVIVYENKKYVLGLNPHGITLIDSMDINNDEFLSLMK